MSQAEYIKRGQILDRKNRRMQVIADAKASLRSLVNEGTYAQGKSIDEINTDSLRAHLDRLIEKRNESRKLQAEIEELEY